MTPLPGDIIVPLWISFGAKGYWEGIYRDGKVQVYLGEVTRVGLEFDEKKMKRMNP